MLLYLKGFLLQKVLDNIVIYYISYPIIITKINKAQKLAYFINSIIKNIKHLKIDEENEP